jgi:hypothetical protein
MERIVKMHRALGLSDEHPLCTVRHDDRCEVFYVRDRVWKKAGMKPWGGCLRIGCLETRIGRRLKPKDFTDHIFNTLPCTPRLLNRRGGP